MYIYIYFVIYTYEISTFVNLVTLFLPFEAKFNHQHERTNEHLVHRRKIISNI